MKLNWQNIKFYIQDNGCNFLIGCFLAISLDGVLAGNWQTVTACSLGFLAVAGYLWGQKVARYWHHMCGQLTQSVRMQAGIIQAQREQLEQYHAEEATKMVRPPGSKSRHTRPN